MPFAPARIIALGALLLATGAALGQTLSSDEPESYRTENYREPTPATLRGARVVSTVEAQAVWKGGSAAFIDVLPRFSPAPNTSRRDAVAGAAPIQHPGKHLVAGCRIRRSFAGSGSLSENGLGADCRRRSRKVSGYILPAGLLDVVERSKAGDHVGIYRGHLVS
jgi:hypothetical protein